jgi:hypothetical protein
LNSFLIHGHTRLEHTPEEEEELPNLNNKPTQEEDDGPLQDVVGAGEGGGPCFTLPLSPRGCSVAKNFHPKTSHRILRHMHGALNVDETKN